MTGYCESTACRRKYLLTYFGEEFTEKNCGSCDNCDHPKEQFDGTEIGQTILACVRQLPSIWDRAHHRCPDGFRECQDQELPARALPVYNSGTGHSKQQLRTWIHELIRQDYLTRVGDKYPVIRLSQKGLVLLKGQARVMLSVPERQASKVLTPPRREDLVPV